MKGGEVLVLDDDDVSSSSWGEEEEEEEDLVITSAAAAGDLSLSSSSDMVVHLTPERSNSSSGGGDDGDGGAQVDPLLRGEAYEMREGVGEMRESGLWVGDDDDEEEEEEDDDDESLVYTAEEEEAVVRKFDRRLVLFVALLYMLSFLDRSNIGNALVAGMDEDLLRAAHPQHAASDGGQSYQWALTSFYVAYIAFEWLSLLWTVVPAHVYMSGIVLSWGLVASLQAVAPSYPVLVALRFLLGIGEAGFAGVPVYLSLFFRREELALRTAVFISAAPLATTFASSLAWLITKLGEDGPIAPWRLLFLVEGFPAVLVATVAWRVVPDSPDRASYLTTREKDIARQRLLPHGRRGRLAADGKGGQGEEEAAHRGDFDDDDDNDEGIRDMGRRGALHATVAVLSDPVPWATAAIFFLANVAYSSLPVFLPLILTRLGHSAPASQALSAPPYLFAFASVLVVSRVSDRLASRGWPIALSAAASGAGYAVLASGVGVGPTARYLALFPAAAGFFCVVVLTISWNINNARGGRRGHSSSRGAGFALMQAVGQCGPLVGTRLYPESDAPLFARGMAVCSACMFAVAGLAVALRAYLDRANRRVLEDVEEGEGEEGQRLVDGGGRGRTRTRTRTRGDGRFKYML